MKQAQITIPDIAFRAAIHNQIYASKYYHVSRYERSERGKLAHVSSWGYRSGGKGGNKALGMSPTEAKNEARKLNAELGWDQIPAEMRPTWLLV